ncbi:hypothetical protein KNO81_19900 [Paraburkholderia sediminicola]|nr:hypothetical protein [Paraburkholderia sediminicola]
MPQEIDKSIVDLDRLLIPHWWMLNPYHQSQAYLPWLLRQRPLPSNPRFVHSTFLIHVKADQGHFDSSPTKTQGVDSFGRTIPCAAICYLRGYGLNLRPNQSTTSTNAWTPNNAAMTAQITKTCGTLFFAPHRRENEKLFCATTRQSTIVHSSLFSPYSPSAIS